jgi:hypothetical protein
MKRSVANFLAFSFMLLPLGIATYMYPRLPGRIPIHFGVDGQPDAWGDRISIFAGPVILGVVSFLVYVLLTNLHKIVTNRFKKHDAVMIRIFAVSMAGFLSMISICILMATIWRGVPLLKLLVGLIGLALIGMGWFMLRAGPNLLSVNQESSEILINRSTCKTRFNIGRLIACSGLIVLSAALVLKGSWLMGVFMVSMLLMGLLTVLYSSSRSPQGSYQEK